MGKVKMQMVTRLTTTDATTDDCEREYRTITTFWGNLADIESAKACLLQGVEQAKSTIAGLEVKRDGSVTFKDEVRYQNHMD